MSRRTVIDKAHALAAEANVALSEGTLESNERAVALLERAVDADSRCAAAHLGLANAYLERADLGLGDPWLDAAVDAGEQALELDPTAADAWLVLGLAYRAKGYLRKELELWQRRLKSDPTDTTARIRGGWVLWFSGRPAEALPWLDAAAAQRPEDRWIHFFLGNANLGLGEFGEAERAYRRALELDPDHSSAHAGVIWSLLAAGNDEAALSRLRLVQASALDGDRYPVKVADIEYFFGEVESALVHARAGVADEPEERYWPRGFLASTILGALLAPSDPVGAAEQLERSEQIDRARLDGGDEGYMPHIDLAAVDAIRGDARGACRALRAAIAAGWSCSRALVVRERLFESLRGDDEFRSLAAG